MVHRKEYYGTTRTTGELIEDENGFSFRYLDEYLDSEGALPISLTMPLRHEEYRDKVLFPFFDGLIPEGWLLNIAENNWKTIFRSATACGCSLARRP